MKFITFLLLLASSTTFSQLVKVKHGPFQPGFVSFTRFDSTRPAVKEQKDKKQGRIIQVNVWYPSTGVAQKMNFAEYVWLAGLELDSDSTNNWKETGIERYFQWPASLNADKKLFLRFLKQKIPTAAGKKAAFTARKFPFVMIMHGFAADHAYLAEFLASHGYIVLHIPVKGSDKYELDYAGRGLEYQVLDYEFGWKVIKKEFPFITTEVAVVGFSFGGQSAMALALKNKDIKSLISLDGGIGSKFGADLVTNLPYYNKDKVSFPILHLYNPKDEYTDLAWIKSLTHTNRYLAAMKNMEHGHFTSFGALNKPVPGIIGNKSPVAEFGYEATMILVVAFIEKTLKHKDTVGQFFIHQKERYPWINDALQSVDEYSRRS